MEYTQLFGGVEIYVPTPARLTWMNNYGELHSVCEAVNRVVVPMKKLYTPLGVESLVNDRGA